MSKGKKKRVSARAKTPTTKPVPSGMQTFVVHLLNPPSEHMVTATDEEDAAERICTRWEHNAEVVKVVRQPDGVVFEVRGRREDGEWNSSSSEIQLPDLPKREHPSDPPPPPKPIPDFQCSFCGKQQREVKKLIAGPTVYICDECLTLSVEICLEDGVDVVKKAKEDLSEDEKREAATERAVQERTRKIDRAEAVLAALRNDKPEDAKTQILELTKDLGAELFTQQETQKLVALMKDASDAKMSIGVYIEEVKRRIAIYERVTKSKSEWEIPGVLAAALGGAGMAYMLSKFGREPKTP